jgi:hypothetical protein
MDLKERVTQIIQDELGDYIEGMRFTGSYEGEEFNVIITLHDEPDDFEKRDTRLHYIHVGRNNCRVAEVKDFRCRHQNSHEFCYGSGEKLTPCCTTVFGS